MMTLWPRQSPCLVIGHRGAMGYAPENTLVSFEEALRRGADLVEMDVQLSADNEIVVMHDTSVGRTTNGEGFVRDLPWKKIKNLDAGVWFGPNYVDEFVPSLENVIAKFRNRKTSKGAPLGFIIELKTIKGSGGSLADAVVALLKKENFTDRVVIISFDTVALQEVRQADKHLPTGLLYSEGLEEARLQQALSIGAQTLCPRKTCVTSKGILAAHKANLSVSTWTANTKVEMKRLIACGVDAVTTNYPDRLRSLMS
jgi:glycerophosphoryl diester phosphodiesterase